MQIIYKPDLELTNFNVSRSFSVKFFENLLSHIANNAP